MSFRLDEIFKNGLIIQRNEDIRFFGYGDNDEEIHLLFNGLLKTTTIKNNYFEVIFPKMDKGEDLSLLAYSYKDKYIINDIVIGEIFFALGQSNMEFLLKYEENFNKNIVSLNDKNIRFYKYFKDLYDSRDKIKELSNSFSTWEKMDSIDKEKEVSAVSYYFARYLKNKLNVPIGIIECNHGGTSLTSWIDIEILKNNKKYDCYLEDYLKDLNNLDLEEYNKTFLEKDKFVVKDEFFIKLNDLISASTPLKEKKVEILKSLTPLQLKYLMLPRGPLDANVPGKLYDRMLKKIFKINAKGIIFYQGESDEKYADLYYDLFKDFISLLRKNFNKDIPIFTCLLAPFHYWLNNYGTNFPILRDNQIKASKNIDNVFITSLMDVGNKFDIHPKNKLVVGERLAKLVLNKLYNKEDLIADPLELKEIYIKSNKLFIRFNNVGDHLILRGERLNDLYINDLEINSKDINISKDLISISLDNKDIEITNLKKVKIKYLYKDYVEANLFNTSLIPALPFNIEMEINK